jgi:K+-sensing histidine kinase KdpD
LRPSELCVLANALPRNLKQDLFQHTLQATPASMLVCAQAWQPVSRILVLNQHRDPGSRFLEAAAEICHNFRVPPAVLTVAWTEEEARRRQQFAQVAFADLEIPADFDLICNCELRTAVAAIARWRHCSHVLLERRRLSPWRRWLHGEPIQQLLGLSDSLTLLTLSESVPSPRAGLDASSFLMR